MKFKIITLFLIFALTVGLLPVRVAAEDSVYNDIIKFDDGSYLKVTIEEFSYRATNTKSGSKRLEFYDSSDNVEWEATLSASFTYTGTTSTCTSASSTLTIYDNAWYEISRITSRSGNTASMNLIIGKKFLGITISKPEHNIKLTCDENGNLS